MGETKANLNLKSDMRVRIIRAKPTLWRRISDFIRSLRRH